MNNKIRWQNFRPILKRVLVALEQEEKSKTESGLETINWDAPKNHFRVLGMASDCELPIRINDLVFCLAKNPKRMHERCINAAEGVFLYDQNDILMAYEPKLGPCPFGNKVLIKRRNRTELMLDSKIIIPEGIQSKDQTMEAEIVAFGLGGVWMGTGLNLGDRVQLTEWDMSHAEVKMPDGYYLIVDKKFISHKIEDDSTLIERT